MKLLRNVPGCEVTWNSNEMDKFKTDSILQLIQSTHTPAFAKAQTAIEWSRVTSE